MHEELSAWLCRMPVREVKMSSKSLFNKQIVLSVIEALYKYQVNFQILNENVYNNKL